MKLRSLVLLTIASALTTASFAQKGGGSFHVGVKAGANIFKVDGTAIKDEFKFGYNLGAFAEIKFDDQWGLQPEAMWNQTNYRTASNFNEVYPGGKSDLE
ncbi:MAG TPA: outer membrane beta-barrel protein, partial [Niastella sp.]|nr:outer membrane beta-barrel protein [Niastella sp.]